MPQQRQDGAARCDPRDRSYRGGQRQRWRDRLRREQQSRRLDRAGLTLPLRNDGSSWAAQHGPGTPRNARDPGGSCPSSRPLPACSGPSGANACHRVNCRRQSARPSDREPRRRRTRPQQEVQRPSAPPQANTSSNETPEDTAITGRNWTGCQPRPSKEAVWSHPCSPSPPTYRRISSASSSSDGAPEKVTRPRPSR